MKSLQTPETNQEVIDRINQLTPKSQRLWGKMSVEQMFSHVGDQIKICLEMKPAKPYGNPIVQKIMKLAALNIPLKFPKNLKTIEELDPDKTLMTQPKSFEFDKSELLKLLKAYHQQPEGKVFGHPVFGKVTKSELGKLTFFHLDHHLKQFGV